MFTQIGLYSHGTSMASFLHFEHLLKTNSDLRYSRAALFGERIVLLASAHEEISEDILLEMVHEVIHAGERLRSELKRL
jgi:hypothetical protein